MLRLHTSAALLCASSLALASPSAFAAPNAIVPSQPSGTATAPLADARVSESVGLYPLQLPEGLHGFAAKLSEQLHDGAVGLPHLRAFDLIPRGACMFDEPGCLADAARSAELSRMVSGRVQEIDRGYTFELRLTAASDGKELGTQRGSVEGGPLDLEGGLEHGLCELLGAAPCMGTLRVRSEDAGGTNLFIDGVERGALPLEPLSIPVGRHLVRAGSQELRVRVSYLRETQLVCAQSGGALVLREENVGTGEVAAPRASTAAPVPSLPAEALSPRMRTARLALAAGGALLMMSTGVELYSRAESQVLNNRYQSGQLTAADSASYGRVHSSGVAAAVLGVMGVGALATGGLLFLLSPDGGAVQGKF